MHSKSPIKSSLPFLFNPKFISFFLMASLFFITLLSFLLYFSLTSSATRHHHHHHQATPSLSSPSQDIHQACQATRFPQTCESSLTQLPNLPNNPKPVQIIQSAMWVSSQNLKTGQSMVKTILDSATGNINRTNAAKNCIELLGYSEYRLNSTVDALPRGRFKDGRAWTSAALLYEYDCWSALKYVNDTQRINETMAFLNDVLITSTSNSLSLLRAYDLFGEKIGLWKPPATERSGFWEDGGVSGSDFGFKGGFPTTPDVTVCKEGGKGCVQTVQEAVNMAPNNEWDRKFVIKINEGVYKETVRVPLEKKNVVFLGDGIGKSVITGSLNVGQVGITTYTSATVGVVGERFMARDMTFENTAGPDAHQAVAFRSDSDLSILENCEFLGNQDTLYAKSLRQYYKSCRIEGNVDFIFGNSASVFQDSTILIRPRQLNPTKGENNAVTAHGRTDPAQSTGYVFQNCVINGTEDYMKLYYSKPKVHKNFLGRPWKEYSRTVFIHCTMEALITPNGWLPWSGDFALSTLYYGEFENSGPGANISGRVSWSSQIPKEHVLVYSPQNFIQGNEWIPTSSQ